MSDAARIPSLADLQDISGLTRGDGLRQAAEVGTCAAGCVDYEDALGPHGRCKNHKRKYNVVPQVTAPCRFGVGGVDLVSDVVLRGVRCFFKMPLRHDRSNKE